MAGEELGGLVFWAIMGTVELIAISGIAIAWTIMNLLTPKPAKQITHASWFHDTLLLLFQGNHVAEVLRAKVMPQGYLLTREKTPRHFLLFKPSYKPLTREYEDTTLNNQEKEALKIYTEREKLEREILPASTLKGTRIPIFIANVGTAIAFSLDSVTALTHDKQFLEGSIVGKDDAGKNKDIAVQVVLPVDPFTATKHINALINSIDMEASHLAGVEKGKRMNKNPEALRLFFFVSLALLVAGMAFFVISYFLK